MIKIIPFRNKDCLLKHLQRKLKQLAKCVVPTYVIKEREQKEPVLGIYRGKMSGHRIKTYSLQ